MTAPTFLPNKKRKEKQRKKSKSQYVTVKMLPRSKPYCLAVPERLKFKFFLVGERWWPTILFSVPFHLHFEIHFAGPEKMCGFEFSFLCFAKINPLTLVFELRI